ncbi:unnamed protein product [Amoebophrya sp. A120]|nr:unnamed protein product [Amoebophrya sp. A120]|eukprot:GSA120T00020482001.1
MLVVPPCTTTATTSSTISKSKIFSILQRPQKFKLSCAIVVSSCAMHPQKFSRHNLGQRILFRIRRSGAWYNRAPAAEVADFFQQSPAEIIRNSGSRSTPRDHLLHHTAAFNGPKNREWRRKWRQRAKKAAVGGTVLAIALEAHNLLYDTMITLERGGTRAAEAAEEYLRQYDYSEHQEDGQVSNGTQHSPGHHASQHPPVCSSCCAIEDNILNTHNHKKMNTKLTLLQRHQQSAKQRACSQASLPVTESQTGNLELDRNVTRWREKIFARASGRCVELGAGGCGAVWRNLEVFQKWNRIEELVVVDGNRKQLEHLKQLFRNDFSDPSPMKKKNSSESRSCREILNTSTSSARPELAVLQPGTTSEGGCTSTLLQERPTAPSSAKKKKSNFRVQFVRADAAAVQKKELLREVVNDLHHRSTVDRPNFDTVCCSFLLSYSEFPEQILHNAAALLEEDDQTRAPSEKKILLLERGRSSYGLIRWLTRRSHLASEASGDEAGGESEVTEFGETVRMDVLKVVRDFVDRQRRTLGAEWSVNVTTRGMGHFYLVELKKQERRDGVAAAGPCSEADDAGNYAADNFCKRTSTEAEAVALSGTRSSALSFVTLTEEAIAEMEKTNEVVEKYHYDKLSRA